MLRWHLRLYVGFGFCFGVVVGLPHGETGEGRPMGAAMSFLVFGSAFVGLAQVLA
jgi:hypothetical protein